MPYPFPYIMDPPQVEGKVAEETLKKFKFDKLPTPILRKIIVEMSKYNEHCYLALEHCSKNVDLIIDGKDPVRYPSF